MSQKQFQAPAYWQPDAPATPVQLVTAAFMAIAPMASVGILYAFAILYCPLIYACVLLTVGFGWAIGAVGAIAFKQAALRSPRARGVITVLLTTVAYVISFIAWLFILVARDTRSWSPDWLLNDPRALLRVLGWVYENGVWGLWEHGGSVNVDGPILVCVWVGEFALTLIMALLVAGWRFTRELYCENCRRWCGPPSLLRRYRSVNGMEVKLHLEQHDWDYLATLLSGGRYDPKCVDIEYTRCATCDRLHAITLTRDTAKTGPNGGFKRERLRIMDHLLVTPGDVETIRDMPSAEEVEG